jgi:mono/diheme cytochrome c family protein
VPTPPEEAASAIRPGKWSCELERKSIVISGTRRSTPDGALSMPAFGNAYSDTEIAALANYVTGRFGRSASRITAQDVAGLRKQASE